MTKTQPRVTKDVLELIGGAEVAVQRGELSKAQTLAYALHDAGFRNTATDIERKIKEAADEDGEPLYDELPKQPEYEEYY